MDLFREGADQRTRRRVRPPVLVCMVESVSSVTVFFWLLSPLTESRVFVIPQAANDPMLVVMIKVKTIQQHRRWALPPRRAIVLRLWRWAQAARPGSEPGETIAWCSGI